MKDTLTTKQKALQINLDTSIYGTFAEIGAGQEVVRHFFRSGGASGTIAKAMSAYDKDFSNDIYGKEDDGRFVTENRLNKMLNHEFGLILKRLNRDDHPEKRFFTFANTITTINFAKTFKGHGWLGIRFQLQPDSEANDVLLHIRLHENKASLQQESIGVLGVNLIYGCFNYYHNTEELLLSLYNNLSNEQIEVDTIRVKGPAFKQVDNRLLSLQLVKHGMTDAVIFGPDGKNLLPAQVLYKKNILALRGSFRPVTKVNIDMIKNGYQEFIKEKKVSKENLQVLFEITLSNLRSEGEIDERDFLDRANLLCSIGQTVLISNYQEYYKLVEYFSRFTTSRMGLILGVNNLLEIFDDKYYKDLNGGILEAFGILFSRDLKIFLYPYLENEEILNSTNIKIHPRLKALYNYLSFNNRIIDIKTYDPSFLTIFSAKVLQMLKEGEGDWENMVPTYVDNIIKENQLFGFKEKKEIT